MPGVALRLRLAGTSAHEITKVSGLRQGVRHGPGFRHREFVLLGRRIDAFTHLRFG